MITVTLHQVKQSTISEGQVRGHRIHIDRPADKGGADAGPMGGEVLLLALGGCFMSNLIAALQARDHAVRDLKTTVTGELGGQPARFERVVLEVHGTPGDEGALAKAITLAERSCIVANTLKDTLQLEVKRAAAGPR